MLALLAAVCPTLGRARTAAAQAQPGDPSIVNPTLLRTPRPRYPMRLLRFGMEGRVVVEVMVDTTGRPDGRTIRVVESPDAGFEPEARRVVLGARFRPGSVAGQVARLPARVSVGFVMRWEELLPRGCPRTSAAADTNIVPVAPVDTAGAVSEPSVEERPERLSTPPLAYPEDLWRQGIEGRVLVQATLDTLGCVEPRSVRVVESTHPGFQGSAMAGMVATRWRPGRINGRPVRVIVRMPVNFVITGW